MKTWAVVIGSLLFVACGYSTRIGGLYQADRPITMDSSANPVFLELVASQYGPEVGGLVHLYSDRFMTFLSDPDCKCAYIENATVRDGKFTFLFHLPGKCLQTGLKGDISITGSGFNADSDPMQGKISISCSEQSQDCPVQDKTFIINLTKTTEFKELKIEDKQCP